jgi:hypothetical protein
MSATTEQAKEIAAQSQRTLDLVAAVAHRYTDPERLTCSPS